MSLRPSCPASSSGEMFAGHKGHLTPRETNGDKRGSIVEAVPVRTYIFNLLNKIEVIIQVANIRYRI